ncbi:hypothetical protein [Clostridium estertheticum]|uniref:hypothetical protein n=1 Tax=Clostridium estertheticum TaxID=238834 RepID=UPI001C6E4BCA|nr:hypothetical protein [Clostridium estertheticum]MBW9154493.1 hypothetical protein [Clostridium estertheticum]WLC86455.1 hypothetical protein KTC97_21455 [Clostridium estertheticum]
MKRINQYFSSGCVAFTVTIIIVIIIHFINHQLTLGIKSEASLIFLILVIQSVLYFMENIHVKSPITHMLFELLIIISVTFSIGIPMKVINIISLSSAIEIFLTIALAYAIACLSLYINSTNDAKDINKKLQEK